MPTTIGYTGQRRGSGLGSLMFYNARYYSPLLSRFVSADTVVPGAGNPQARNRYAYVYNNPIKYTDPTGYFSESELDKYYPGWRDWSEMLKNLMLGATTWGSILYLGNGGDEPSLIVMAILEQTENGDNSFVGTFLGLDGPDREQFWYESPHKLGKYSHGAVYNPVNSNGAVSNGGYAMEPRIVESPTRQGSEKDWINDNTLDDIIGPQGHMIGQGQGLARYYEYGWTMDWRDLFDIKDSVLNPLNWIPEAVNMYPVILAAPDYGYGQYGVVSPSFSTIGASNSYWELRAE